MKHKAILKIFLKTLLGLICGCLILGSLSDYHPNYLAALLFLVLGGPAYYSGLVWLYKSLL